MLTHPVISSLLQHKWFHFGLWLYLLNLLIYIIFLGFLTAFALVDIPPQSNTCMCPSWMQTILLCSFHSYRLEACMMLIVQPSWGWYVPTRKTRMLYIDGSVSYSCVVRYRVLFSDRLASSKKSRDFCLWQWDRKSEHYWRIYCWTRT